MTLQTEERTEVRFSPRRLGHANMFVGDFERSFDFYHRLCGFEVAFGEQGGRKSALMSNGNTHHDIAISQVREDSEPVIGRGGHVQIPKGRGIQPGLNHFGWELEHQKALVDAYHRAQETGLELHRVADHTVSRSIYLFDPDGHLHEMYADAVKDWWTCFDGHIPPREMTGEWDPDGEPSWTDIRYHPSPEITQVEGATLHPTRITHAVLITRLHERMVDFYSSVAGLERVAESADGDAVCFAGAHAGYAFDVALFRGDAAAVHHYGYALADESAVEDAEGALKGAGVTIEKSIDGPCKRSFFIRDPDGQLLEFHAARSPDPAAALAASADERLYLV